MPEERIDLRFATEVALRQLSDIQRTIDNIKANGGKMTMSFQLGAAGAGVLQGGLNAMGATGAAIQGFQSASPLERLVMLVETIARLHFPSVLAKLDIVGRAQGAQAAVSPLLEQAARLNIKVSDKQLSSLVEQALASEERAMVARGRVQRAVGLGAAEAATEGSGLQKALDKLIGPRDVQPRNR